ncbi:MAG: hypothetical protein OHK0047_24270 [Leptolyngbyaceae cyanobacterium]
MVFDRPQKPGQSQPNQAMQRPTAAGQSKKVITTGSNRGNTGGGRGRGNGGGGDGGRGRGNGEPLPSKTSPWLKPDQPPEPHATASFVEYLRWMRSPDSEYKDPTKVQILQMAEEKADYRERLEQLNKRTELIAGAENCFEVTCPWRIRVGGHRGPESILLPAFDALGMPYIPSSTLRGVARNQAIREKLKLRTDLDYSNKEAVKAAWQEADRQVAEWFGHLAAEDSDRIGKVIFLDAYPIASASQKDGGLAMDMANNIWSWKDDTPEYKPNPNPYLSLKQSTFLIGLRRSSDCRQEQFDQIKQWLIAGLEAGIGSQVNSGYGSLLHKGSSAALSSEKPLFQVDFTLRGQLIHSHQKFDNVSEPYQRNQDGQFKRDRDRKLKANARGVTEMRPVAFKSMLRYWFRTFALGVMSPSDVKHWEAKLFGAIDPQTWGWVHVTLSNVTKIRDEARRREDNYGEYRGTLSLSYSSEAQFACHDVVSDLLKHLTWLMFHLGGVGQGARRPCYSRRSRSFAPWWRGSTLVARSNHEFWYLPETKEEFQKLFRERLISFYNLLKQLVGREFNPQQPRVIGQVRKDLWSEVIDRNCRIIVCSGAERLDKPYALAVLHSEEFKLEVIGKDGQPKVKDGQVEKKYDPDLCGQVLGRVKPSPVWISNLGKYQVVTIFGATENPRKKYLESLQGALQIFPLT